jgi:hypothetical protein
MKSRGSIRGIIRGTFFYINFAEGNDEIHGKTGRIFFCPERESNLATLTCRLYENPGSVNILEPFGPTQACNGVAFAVLSVPSVIFQ